MTQAPEMVSLSFELSWLQGHYAVARLPPDAPIPEWAASGAFTTVSRTPEELSIVCADHAVPDSVRREGGWACLRLHGPVAFGQIGVVASLARPLAEAGVGILAISTFDTDYLLVKVADAGRAERALRASGHEVCPLGADT